ncbi:MAG: hypothetical protein NZ957_01540 [Thaumarchaeota archaeon]|nr:hypothetical protein [Candidatus Calditenuaceae archaeon]
MPDEIIYKPAKYVLDPYPIINGMAVDPHNRMVFLSDTNLKSLLMYSLDDATAPGDVVRPRRHIIGPQTEVGFVAGVAVDPNSGEIFAVNNDIEDSMVVFDYEDDGNVRPKRKVMVPHRAWGISLSEKEIAISVQTFGVVVLDRQRIYSAPASCPHPDRSIYGLSSDMADPRGIFLDEKNNEIVVACHGNWNQEGVMIRELDLDVSEMQYGGRFLMPSVNFYDRNASGDHPPKRKISGQSTQLNWPMGIHVNVEKDEVFVANNGDDSVLVFDRRSGGDVSPKRVIRGKSTGINRPVSVQVDTESGELWVANLGDRSVLVFDEDSDGNVPPKRVLRLAPPDAHVIGFGNPMAATFDSRRRQVIVANCVTQPRLYAFDPVTSGAPAPLRVVEGQRTRLSRTMHGICYNPLRDEVVVPNPLAAAILTFRAGADGEEPPLRVIQGPRTGLITPHAVNLNLKRGELLVGDPGRKGALVFGIEDSGNVKPRRVIAGKRTRIDHIVGVTADESGTLIVANSARRRKDAITGLLFFDRDADGDVEPIGYIAGPKTMMKEAVWWVQTFKDRIIASVPNHVYRPCFKLASCDPEVTEIPPSPWLTADGFIGVWNIDDRGDVPPRLVIKGHLSELCAPSAFAINPVDGEIYVLDSVKNGMFVFRVPQAFTD